MIADLLGELGLVAPTAALAHRDAGRLSIDHVAVPAAWGAVRAERVAAVRGDGARLSDHEAYVVEVGERHLARGADDAGPQGAF